MSTQRYSRSNFLRFSNITLRIRSVIKYQISDCRDVWSAFFPDASIDSPGPSESWMRGRVKRFLYEVVTKITLLDHSSQGTVIINRRHNVVEEKRKPRLLSFLFLPLVRVIHSPLLSVRVFVHKIFLIYRRGWTRATKWSLSHVGPLFPPRFASMVWYFRSVIYTRCVCSVYQCYGCCYCSWNDRKGSEGWGFFFLLLFEVDFESKTMGEV